jgi:serine phosphatase RsbU (regulator of sigma subunit)
MSDDSFQLRTLQRLLLPAALPAIGCTEAAAAYASHNDHLRLGGDWFDMIDRNDDQIVAIVGDVVGHGLAQIGVMGQLRAASNALARVVSQPDELLEAVDAFAAEVPGSTATTMMAVMLDGTSVGRIASAGHPPLIRVQPTGEVTFIEGGRRAPLGVPGAQAFAEFEVAVGDILLMFTDGLVERRGVSIDKGMKALGEFVLGHIAEPCSTLSEMIMDEFATDADDDVAVLVMRPRNHRSIDYRLQQRVEPSVTFRAA